MPDAIFEPVSTRVDRFTPDDRTDRPVLGAIAGSAGTLLVDGGASPAHLSAFVEALAAHGRPPVVAIALTHWHWDHSFGSAAIDVPVIACEETARQLAIQRSYAWDDVSLQQRVAAGLELEFCRDHLVRELPDRSDLDIVLPTVVFDQRHEIDLGDVSVVLDRVGGDHAADAVVVWVPDDRVLFLGDALYQCLHAPVAHMTVAGVRELVSRLAPYAPLLALEGHDPEVADADAYARRLEELERACDLVERLGDDALTASCDDEGLTELVAFLLAGRSGP